MSITERTNQLGAKLGDAGPLWMVDAVDERGNKKRIIFAQSFNGVVADFEGNTYVFAEATVADKFLSAPQ